MSTQFGSAKILVVDDERSMREFLEIMLMKDGYDVHCASSGTEALELIHDASLTS